MIPLFQANNPVTMNQDLPTCSYFTLNQIIIHFLSVSILLTEIRPNDAVVLATGFVRACQFDIEVAVEVRRHIPHHRNRTHCCNGRPTDNYNPSQSSTNHSNLRCKAQELFLIYIYECDAISSQWQWQWSSHIIPLSISTGEKGCRWRKEVVQKIACTVNTREERDYYTRIFVRGNWYIFIKK